MLRNHNHDDVEGQELQNPCQSNNVPWITFIFHGPMHHTRVRSFWLPLMFARSWNYLGSHRKREGKMGRNEYRSGLSARMRFDSQRVPMIPMTDGNYTISICLKACHSAKCHPWICHGDWLCIGPAAGINLITTYICTCNICTTYHGYYIHISQSG